ncbi:hypothetical protein R3P38DRAFT_2799423 [Favolaschia claudopus]|uniref:FACT complex subunit n=1 Tax=Favolaschia claudopus TaxID=2862362 RepID=A0AAV9ZZQ2_9AGAR
MPGDPDAPERPIVDYQYAQNYQAVLGIIHGLDEDLYSIKVLKVSFFGAPFLSSIHTVTVKREGLEEVHQLFYTAFKSQSNPKHPLDFADEEDNKGEDTIRDLVKPRKLKPQGARKFTESGQEKDGQKNDFEDDGDTENVEDEDYNPDDNEKGKTSGKKNLRTREMRKTHISFRGKTHQFPVGMARKAQSSCQLKTPKYVVEE